MCKKINSKYIDADDLTIEVYDVSINGTKFSLTDGLEQYRFNLKNIGRHQAENAATAFAALSVLKNSGINFEYDSLKKGINSTFMDSRVQSYPDKKIIIDASHNPEGVFELGAVINELLPNENIVLLCSVFKTKDIKEMVYEYSKFTDYAVITQSSHPLTSDSDSLCAEFAAQNIKSTHFEKIDAAVEKALEEKGEDKTLVVSGSFYMIADMKRALEIE
jgi:dihydrofolate synthase/folylpolyglutamate synthase